MIHATLDNITNDQAMRLLTMRIDCLVRQSKALSWVATAFAAPFPTCRLRSTTWERAELEKWRRASAMHQHAACIQERAGIYHAMLLMKMSVVQAQTAPW